MPPPEDPQLRSQVDALQARVDRVEALLEAGKHKEALAKLRDAEKELERVRADAARAARGTVALR